MAQQNVPTPAFTEFESSIKIPYTRSELKAIEIPFIRSELKAMACTHCDDSSEVYFWLKVVEALDDEKLLKCYKEFERSKEWLESLFESLSVFDKKQAYDTESFNTILARIAVSQF